MHSFIPVGAAAGLFASSASQAAWIILTHTDPISPALVGRQRRRIPWFATRMTARFRVQRQCEMPGRCRGFPGLYALPTTNNHPGDCRHG